MGTYVVLVLAFGGGLLPGAYIALLFCLLAGGAAQYAALKHGKGPGRWLIPVLLAVLWLALELVASNAVNYAQMVSMIGLGIAIFCFLGAALGSAAWLTVKTVRRNEQSVK